MYPAKISSFGIEQITDLLFWDQYNSNPFVEPLKNKFGSLSLVLFSYYIPCCYLVLSFSIVKIDISVIHQIRSILQDKSIGALKITYGHHPWSQKCLSYIRKALLGLFLILYFLVIHISVVIQMLCIFYTNPMVG